MNDEFPSVHASEQKRKEQIYAQGLLRATPCREGSACGVSADNSPPPPKRKTALVMVFPFLDDNARVVEIERK